MLKCAGNWDSRSRPMRGSWSVRRRARARERLIDEAADPRAVRLKARRPSHIISSVAMLPRRHWKAATAEAGSGFSSLLRWLEQTCSHHLSIFAQNPC